MSEHEQPNVKAPAEAVRCYYGWGHVIGEYAKTALVVGTGLGFCNYYALNVPFPFNILGAVLYVALFAFLLYMVTRYDYAWIVVDESRIRAKHLYWPRIVDRRIEEIKELRTVLSAGKIKAVKVVFWNVRLPIATMRIDMAMTNAREAIDALMIRMEEIEKKRGKMADRDERLIVHPPSCHVRDTLEP